jgi:hypothetical protein
MKRVKRRVMNALAGLSLILALATGGLWERSYWVADCAYWQSAKVLAWTQSRRGDLLIQLDLLRVNTPLSLGVGYEQHGEELGERRCYDLRGNSFPMPPNVITLRKCAGFWCCDMSDPSEPLVVAVAFPHWSLLLALSILPALRGWQLLRARRRRSENLCPQCGYDLRATPQRCPECGHETPAGARLVLK